MSRYKHGHSSLPGEYRKQSPEYSSWASMKTRCFNRNDEHWPKYGGAGVTVCQSWKDSFEAFLADMGPRPSRRHSLDRYPNRDGDYEPGNVRWATPGEQQRNLRTNIRLTFSGRTLTLIEWAEMLGCSVPTLTYRVKQGWSAERTLTTPIRGYVRRTDVGIGARSMDSAIRYR